MTSNPALPDNLVTAGFVLTIYKGVKMAFQKRISAQDLYRMELITDSDISPDGKNAIYAVQRIDQSNEKKYSNLWMLDIKFIIK